MVLLRRATPLTMALAVALAFSGCTSPNFVVQGVVYVEDPNSNPTDGVYTYVSGGDITIRSGSAEATTGADGSFELEGDTTPGLILLEAEKSGYQTAYMFVNVEAIASWDSEATEDAYEQTIEPQLSIRMKSGTGTINFDPDGSVPTIETLNEGQNQVVFLLLKAADGTNWNVFQYAEPSKD